MKHLIDIVNESIEVAQPFVDNDKVKVLALVSSEYVDDNLGLMKGMNRVCLVWSPEDEKGYLCANGGVKWNDGKQWTSLKDIDNIFGRQDWKKVDDINVGYAYRGQIGGRTGYDIEVYCATVSLKDLMKVYKQNGVSLYIYKRSYATATLKHIFDEWKKKKLI